MTTYKHNGMTIHVKSVAYQRNGIAGSGFYAFSFLYDGKNFVGWDHGEDGDAWSGCYGVICIDDPASKWRGDNFIIMLRAAAAEYDARNRTADIALP